MRPRFASFVPHCCRRVRAFTLIEVMVALLVAGLLACVAVPAYSDYVRRSQLPEAFGALAGFRARMEQYYQDHRSYGASDCADAAGHARWKSFPATEHFSYSCSIDSARQGFTIVATGRTAPASGHVFTIDHNGDRATRQFKGEAVAARCWLTSSGRC